MAAIRQSLTGMRDRITGWYERNFTWKGFVLFILFLVKEIPDDFGRKDFWRAKLPELWRVVSAHSTVFTILLVGGLIWLDHRMVLHRRAQVHDDKTLNGRTRVLCEELRAFQKELGPEPQINWKPGNSATTFTEANKEMIEREQRMHHYFHIRLYEKAVGLWHEHGAEMRESQPLAHALAGRIGSDEKLNEVIKMFTELAQD
jgi:hypothetical protein